MLPSSSPSQWRGSLRLYCRSARATEGVSLNGNPGFGTYRTDIRRAAFSDARFRCLPRNSKLPRTYLKSPSTTTIRTFLNPRAAKTPVNPIPKSQSYGVIIAPGLGERFRQSIRSSSRQGQPLLRWLFPLDNWPSSHWIVWPE